MCVVKADSVLNTVRAIHKSGYCVMCTHIRARAASAYLHANSITKWGKEV